MRKRKVFYFGLEPLKARYTYQLCKEWMPATFETYKDKLQFIDIEGDFDPDQEIKVGAVLDAIGRGKYSLTQCERFLQHIYDGDVEDGDVIFLQDYWTPGLDAIWYALDLYGINVKVYGMLHAQSVDEYDFTYDMKDWMRPYELGLDKRLTGIFVGSSIHKALKRNGFGNNTLGGKIFTPKRKELDLLNKSDVVNWFKKNKPTIVILAAAKVGGIYSNSTYPADFILENLKIQTNIIEASWRSNIKRLIFLGSSCIYPKLSKQPIKEEYLLEGELESTNLYYAIAKIAGMKLCEALNIQYNFDSIALMPTNLYGPGDNYNLENGHVMAALIRKFCDAVNNDSKSVTCWGTGSPLREFLHVDDLSDAIIFCLNNCRPHCLVL